MTAKHSPDAAVQDADLIRWLDGELDNDERGRIDRALATDSSLSQRLEQLRGRGARLASLLDATDADPVAAPAPVAGSRAKTAKLIELNAAWAAQQGVEPHVVPPPRVTPGWLRAAAVIAVLLAGSLFVPPVRAWIASAFAPATRGEDENASGDAPAAIVPIDTLVIRFAMSAPTFTIEFLTAPAGGRLLVDRIAVDQASAALYTPGGSEEFQRIREDLLRVVNAPPSTANYRFVLPAEVDEVIVRVPGRNDVVWRFGTGELSRTLELGGGIR